VPLEETQNLACEARCNTGLPVITGWCRRPKGRPQQAWPTTTRLRLSRNIFVHLSADQTSTTVTVAIGTEHQLALVLAWSAGLANHQAQGNVTYTD